MANSSQDVHQDAVAKESCGSSPKSSSTLKDVKPSKEENISVEASDEAGNNKQEDPDAITPVSDDDIAKGHVRLENDFDAGHDSTMPLNDANKLDFMTTSIVDLKSVTQSKLDKEVNLKEAENLVAPKFQNEPDSVTKEDAALLQSREARAHGEVSKGGMAAQVQHLADINKT